MAVKPKATGKAGIKAKSDLQNPSPKNDIAHLSEDIISNVGIGIYIIQHGKFIFVSPLFQKLTGYPKTKIMGQNSLIHVHPDDRAMVKEKAIKSLKGKAKDNYEYRYIRKNGEILWLLEMVVPVKYNGERAVLGSFMDITERKQAEIALLESQKKYGEILDSIEEDYYEVDLAGNLTFFNDSLIRKWGYSREELMGMNYRQYMDTENAEQVFQSFNEVYSTGKPVKNCSWLLIRKDGTKTYFETSIAVRKDSAGNTLGFRGVGHDITERKRAEQALRQSEERYRTILENIEDGYIEVDLKGNFIFANEAACKIQGFSRDEMLKKNYRDLMDRENAQKIFARYNKVYTTGESDKDAQYEIITKNGRKRYLESSITPVKDESGRIYAFRGIIRDRTDRRAAEEAVRRSEEKYRNILESIEDGYFETDITGNFVLFNNALCRIFAYTKEELMGMGYKKYTDKENSKILFRVFNECYRTGMPVKAHDVIFIRKDGLKAVITISVSLVRNPQGEPIGFRGIARDITERKQAEEALRQSEEKYRDILESIEEGYFEVDVAGNLTFVNDSMCRIWGYPKEQLIGLNNRQYTDEENAKKLYQTFNEVFRTGISSKAFDWQIIRKDGTVVYIEATVSLRKDSADNVIGFRGTVHNITERKQAEEAQRQSEEKYRGILENIRESYFEVDLYGNFTFFNDSLCRLTGCSKEELVGMNYSNFSDEETSKIVFQTFHKVYKTGEPSEGFDWPTTRKDGIKIYVSASISLRKDPAGKPIGFRGVLRDVTERKRMEEELRQSEEKHRSIIEQMHDGYFEIDLAGNFVHFNEAACRTYGYSKEEMLGLNYKQYTDKETGRKLFEVFTELYKTGIPVKAHALELIRKDGTKSFNEISVSLVKNAKGEAIGFRGIARDITERKRSEEQIRHMATHDTLTELPNRIMFGQLLNHAIRSAKRHRRQLAVLFTDLDRFKIINDTLGHEAGDLLLKTIATRFKQTLRATDVVARLGGDEFVILVEEVDNPGQLVTVAQKILSTAMKPVPLMGEECRVTASVGISIYPKDGEDEQTLMKTADKAMYFAKEEGKNNYQFYSEGMKSQSIEQLSLETHLRLALERNELSLNYQAKLDFKTDVITGVEALLRWHSPFLGDVSPAKFIPVAEETGMIVPIGQWVMKTACAQNVAWQQQGLPPVCMAVNLSFRQLLDENLIEDIKTALRDSDMAPHLLELEITESMVMHNPVRMVAILTQIKDMGVRLAIDDFGTGYSSLAQIKHFPIDTLKVDRSFIRDIPQDAEDKAITQAIISMGKTLSLTVVAEGVETQDQMDFLRQHSCDEMQGYYFSKPVTPEKFAELLRSHVPVV
jgi:diguanylate cyclase (GGDEF)-like protein/PAS domain S-box-containing protein